MAKSLTFKYPTAHEGVPQLPTVTLLHVHIL